MKSLSTLSRNGLKLNTRNIDTVTFVVVMLLIALVILGFIYGTKPAVEGMVYTFMEQFFGALCCISTCVGGLMGLPLAVSGYRERKILKRLQVTPVSSTKLLAAEFMIYMMYCVVSILTLFPVAMLFWEIKIHSSFLLLLGSWSLTVVSALSTNLLIGGTAKNMKSVSVIACILYFPMLIFSGATPPFKVMPSAAQEIIRIFLSTQDTQLTGATFLGSSVDNALLPVVVIYAVTIICSGVSVEYFK